MAPGARLVFQDLGVGPRRNLTSPPEGLYEYLQWSFDRGARRVGRVSWVPHLGVAEGCTCPGAWLLTTRGPAGRDSLPASVSYFTLLGTPRADLDNIRLSGCAPSEGKGWATDPH